jgi:hypothetical protein
MNRLEMCYQLTDSETLYLSNCRFKILETIVCDIGEGDDIAIYTDVMESCLKRKVPKENRIFLLHTE